MSNLAILRKYFPTGTTEGEKHILKKAFVQLEEFSEIVTPPPGSPRVLIGKKGSGKSAIIDFSLLMFERAKVPALLLKPMDFEYTVTEDSSSVGQLTKAAYDILARAVASHLGKAMGGKLLDSAGKALYDEAIAAGLVETDTIGKLAVLLPKLAKPFTDVDLTNLLPGHDKASLAKINSAIAENLKATDRGFYLFIDDTDQVAAPDKPGHLNRIWAFLLAARDLTTKIPELRCVISFREEVWRRLTTSKAGQRDQTDHFYRLAFPLNPTREHVRAIVDKRLTLAASEITPNIGRRWELFFEGSSPKMPYSEERSNWSDMIVIRSRERPRDAVQLVDDLAGTAIRLGSKLITDDIFAKVMAEFSRQRATFLAQETEEECPQMDVILRGFSELECDFGSFKSSTEVVRKHLSKLGGGFSINLFGKILQMQNEDDMFSLWRYLYEVGVLNARVSDNREKDGFRHVYPNRDPGLVSKARWNDMQAVIWEVGPAYRDFLISVQREQSAKTGLPPTHRKNYDRPRGNHR